MTCYRSAFNLTGKTAILTGATGNLGPFFANGLASFGANLVLLDLDQYQLDQLSDDIAKEHSVICNSFKCDLKNQDEIDATIHTITERCSPIDILINNAQATDRITPFEKATIDDWRQTSVINEEGVFLMSQAVGNLMIKQNSGGSIINISSIYAVLAPDHRIYEDALYKGAGMGAPAVYSYTKAGILGLTKYLSAYWAEHRIRVNALSPGGVEGDQTDNFKSKYSNRVPLNRMASESDLIGPLVFLASEASAYITGQNIIVDGGLSAW